MSCFSELLLKVKVQSFHVGFLHFQLEFIVFDTAQ